MEKKNLSAITNTLREVYGSPITYFDAKTENSGNYLFVSDLHGFDPNLVEQLKQIAKKHPPKIVFFLGDIVGTKLLDGLQKRFYDVLNRIKASTNASIEINELFNYLHHISHDFTDQITQMVKNVDRYQHFGHFVFDLPLEIRQILRKDLVSNTNRMAEAMRKFTRQGSLVVIIEGDRDAHTPLDFQADQKSFPLSSHKISFYFKKFIESMRNQRIIFVNKHESIETEDFIFQTISFNGTLNYLPGTFSKTKSNKKTILVSHVQASWEAIKKDTLITSEEEQLSQKTWSVISDLKPNFMVHGHLHDKLLNEQGQECSGYLNDKFNNLKIYYLPFKSHRFINF